MPDTPAGFCWTECTMDEYDFMVHIAPEEYCYYDSKTYHLTQEVYT